MLHEWYKTAVKLCYHISLHLPAKGLLPRWTQSAYNNCTHTQIAGEIEDMDILGSQKLRKGKKNRCKNSNKEKSGNYPLSPFPMMLHGRYRANTLLALRHFVCVCLNICHSPHQPQTCPRPSSAWLHTRAVVHIAMCVYDYVCMLSMKAKFTGLFSVAERLYLHPQLPTPTHTHTPEPP